MPKSPEGDSKHNHSLTFFCTWSVQIVNGWYARVNNASALYARYAKVDKFGNIILHKYAGGRHDWKSSSVVIEIGAWQWGTQCVDWRFAFVRAETSSLADIWADTDTDKRHWLYKIDGCGALPAAQFTTRISGTPLPPPRTFRASVTSSVCTRLYAGGCWWRVWTR